MLGHATWVRAAVAVVVVIAGFCLGADFVSASAVGAHGNVPTWSATEAPLPADASVTGQVAFLTNVSCPVVGQCDAVGYYSAIGGNQYGDALISSLSGGIWTTVQAPLPANAEANPNSDLTGLSCPAPGSCVALGFYGNTGGGDEGFIETLSEGTWTPIEVPLPPNAASNQDASLFGVTCPAAGSCLVVGGYTDTTGHFQSFAVSLSNGAWTAAELPSPVNADPVGEKQLFAVTCLAATSCVAVGTYLATSPKTEGLIETLSGGTWVALETPLPPDVAAADSSLYDVTCPAAGSCVAVGSYVQAGDQQGGMIATLSSGLWTATATASDTRDAPVDIACSATGSCSAVGGNLIETLSRGRWTPARAPGVLNSVSCPAEGSCVAVGQSVSGVSPGLIETLSNGHWTPTRSPIPANANSTDQPFALGLGRVTCETLDSCVAVGGYTDTDRNSQGLIETLSGGTIAPSITSAGHATFTVGRAGSVTLTATGIPVPLITKHGPLPDGLRFQRGKGAATISGTPAPGTAGRYHIVIMASGGVQPRARQSFTLSVMR